MNDNQREFIMNTLMVNDFFEKSDKNVTLLETEETGKSELHLVLKSEENLVIKNVDKKKTDLQFFESNKVLSMFKRVDHIVYEHLSGDNWKLYLIEMKSSVGVEKWVEVKGKFRASYLLAKGIAGMLDMEITETCMFTTYEKAFLEPSETQPVGRRMRLGERLIKPKEEWDGGKFGLIFGERQGFEHIPIKMEKDVEGILMGSLEMC